MKTILFYFTGTGNSYDIANQLVSLAGEEDVIEMDSLFHHQKYDLTNYEKIGFILPVYYNHLPQIGIKVIKNMDLEHSCQIFLIASYSANTGFAFEEFRNIINPKHKLIQEYKVRMPGNYILEYGAFPKKLQAIILNQAKRSIKKINQEIHENIQKSPMKVNFISKRYKNHSFQKIKEFSILGQDFYADDKCILCLKCVKNCPVNNISIVEDKLKWQDKCEQCMRCIQMCPKEAVWHKSLKKYRKRYINPTYRQFV